MRFLLTANSSIVANRSRATRALPSVSKAVAASRPSPPSEGDGDGESGKAWGQQCSPNCGCVLRIEAQLAECPSKTSPTIVQASYHAKRVMATVHSNDDVTRLKPLTTQQRASRPILTSCTCPTLHHLSRQIVERLPGKTLAQIINEVDTGTAGGRSSAAFRHTVLRENVLPAIATDGDGLGTTRKAPPRRDTHANGEGDAGGVREMNATHRHGSCYDLVEDSLLSMIHERTPAPREDTDAEAYSPTLGGYFRMYSHSGRNRPADDSEEDRIQPGENDDVAGREGDGSFSFHDVGDWQRKSPSSFFLFGDDASNGRSSSDDASNLTRLFFQQVKDSTRERLLGGDGIERREYAKGRSGRGDERDRPATDYLQLLDMYGASDDSDEGTEEDGPPATDDWLSYVDRMHSRDGGSTAGSG